MARRSDNYRMPQGERYKVHYTHNGALDYMVVYAGSLNDATNQVKTVSSGMDFQVIGVELLNK